MDRNLLSGLAAVAAVVVVALLLRGRRDDRVDPMAATRLGEPEPEPAPEAPDATEDEAALEAAAVTSDGIAFIGEAHAVRLVPVADEERTRPSAYQPAIGERLHAGDFTGGRVVRGAPGVDPWRLELLGRDGEYMDFAFETNEGARTALELLESRGVVRLESDEDGRPLPPSPEQFEEGRRRREETEEELANLPEIEPEERG